jgi:hypothetical protein
MGVADLLSSMKCTIQSDDFLDFIENDNLMEQMYGFYMFLKMNDDTRVRFTHTFEGENEREMQKGMFNNICAWVSMFKYFSWDIDKMFCMIGENQNVCKNNKKAIMIKIRCVSSMIDKQLSVLEEQTSIRIELKYEKEKRCGVFVVEPSHLLMLTPNAKKIDKLIDVKLNVN